jgi:hypothetical protein
MQASMTIGFVAGVIWGGLWVLCEYFHFTDTAPPFLLFVFFSILIALVSRRLQWQAYSHWRCFGLAGISWLMIISIIHFQPFWQIWSTMSWQSIITDLCLLIQWAVFIEDSQFTKNMVN